MTTAPPVTLAAWLLERIAEDEMVADSVDVDPRRVARNFGATAYRAILYDRPWRTGRDRFLAECEAKRAIIGMVKSTPPYESEEYRMCCGDAVLRALALPYADAPGYRDEWRP